MKIRTQRMSGLPVDEAEARLFESEWREHCDKTYHKHAKIKNPNGSVVFSSIDMDAAKLELDVIEQELQQKYQIKGEVDLPRNHKQWLKLVDQYQTPLMLAKSAEAPHDLVLVIVDTPIG